MRTASLTLALLVAAALAGCTGGTSSEGQLPDGLPIGGSSGSNSTSTSTAPSPGGHGRDNNATFDAYLEVSTDNGTAPLNVTLSFGASASPEGEQANLTWTLEVRSNATAGNSTGNGTAGGNGAGNGTGSSGSGNATGNSTGNSTSSGSSTQTSTSSSTQTSTGSSSGNSTGSSSGNTTSSSGNTTSGSSTGTSTSPPANSTSNQTATSGNATASGNGTVVASFNGTGADLPGNRSVVLNATGTYSVTFTVRSGNETVVVRDHTISVRELPPGSPLGNETRTFEGSFLASEPLLCFGSDEFEWALNDTFAGTTAEVKHVNVTAEADGLADVLLTLTAPNGTEVANGSAIDAVGPFEAGTYVLKAESCVAANADYVLTAIADYTTPGAPAGGP